ASWIAAIVSGGFGGLVGNQGGIRSAAMPRLDLEGATFVATATAIGLSVDAVRMPISFATASRQIFAAWPDGADCCDNRRGDWNVGQRTCAPEHPGKTVSRDRISNPARHRGGPSGNQSPLGETGQARRGWLVIIYPSKRMQARPK